MTTSTLPCEHCGSPLPDGAVFCGECGRAVTAMLDRRPEDSADVQSLVRLAFAERELVDAVTTVTHETEAEAAAHALAEHHKTLRNTHLSTVQAGFAITLGLPAGDPRITAVPWIVDGSNRLEDRADDAVPVLFTASVNGQRLHATVSDGTVQFAGVRTTGPAIAITNLATLADALAPDRASSEWLRGE